jgi:hypothetical protein
MNKMVKKLPIDDFWNIGKNESWFSDMAAKGLHLHSFGKLFVHFSKGEPTKTKYRIDIMYNNPSNEQLDLYKEFGWNFVANTGIFYIFSTPENSSAPELHTDPEEQGYTLIELDKILKKNVIKISIALLIIIGIMLGLTIFYDEPYILIIDSDFVLPLFFVVLELYVLYITILNYKYVKRLKNSLISGTPINHSENWKKGLWRNRTANTILLVITMLGIIIPTARMVKRNEFTLPETDISLPIIRLADIEENSNLKRETSYHDDVDSNNQVHYEWGVLAPVHYDVHEHGIVQEQLWNDLSGEYSPSIYTRFYRLTFESMAHGLLKDLMHRNVYHPMAKIEKIDSKYFKELYVVYEDYSKEIFASWDNNVIYIRYHGNQDMEHILDLLINNVKYH